MTFLFDTEVTLVNLTPHPIEVLNDDNECIVEFAPPLEDAGVRVETIETELGEIQIDCTNAHAFSEAPAGIRIPIRHVGFGSVRNLPKPQPKTFFIVSGLIQANAPERTDLVVPSPLVRDEDGRVIGCRGFAFANPPTR